MVVRNTVVRATIKVNGQPQILGTHSLVTPQSIELKFDTDDYVGGGTPHATNAKKSARQGRPGKGLKYNVQMWVLFSFFYSFSCQAPENTFLGVSLYFLHWMTCFGVV